MDEGEYLISVPFMDADGNVQYATIVVQAYPDMTMGELDVAIHDAITEALLDQDTSGRMSTLLGVNGTDVVYTATGEYDYDIIGFVAGGEFFNF